MKFSVTALAWVSHWVLTVSASCLHDTRLEPRQVQEGGVKVATFGYTGLKGPLHWQFLSPNNSLCATGVHQSPINVITANARFVQGTAGPQLKYPNVESAMFENLGSTVQVLVNGTLTWEGKTYSLKQFHFHTPSEHRMDEEDFPAEMHFVHISADNAIAVIGVPLEMTNSRYSTGLIHNTLNHISKITEPGSVTQTDSLNFNPLMENVMSNGVYTYGGSLTTPPCSEGVTWFVAKQTLPITVNSFEALKRVVRFNSRYTQNNPGEPNLLSYT